MPFREELQAWVEKNPLRLWRKVHDLRQSDLEDKLKVSYHTIHRFEAGMSIPNNEQMDLIFMLSSIDRTQWNQWIEEKPELTI